MEIIFKKPFKDKNYKVIIDGYEFVLSEIKEIAINDIILIFKNEYDNFINQNNIKFI